VKKATIFILSLSAVFYSLAQQTDWTSVEKVFGKKGTVQDNVFKISYPRSDLKVKVGGFAVAPGFALGSWIGFMSMDSSMNMQGHAGKISGFT
jgi:hypothetical protein